MIDMFDFIGRSRARIRESWRNIDGTRTCIFLVGYMLFWWGFSDAAGFAGWSTELGADDFGPNETLAFIDMLAPSLCGYLILRLSNRGRLVYNKLELILMQILNVAGFVLTISWVLLVVLQLCGTYDIIQSYWMVPVWFLLLLDGVTYEPDSEPSSPS